MKHRRTTVFLIILLLNHVLLTAALAHGVVTSYVERLGIEIVARYDTGQPMAGAQVAVYAPVDAGYPPNQAWLTGVCDDQGRFAFVPNAAMPGVWSVRVRQAGHGDMLHITVDASNETGAAGTLAGETDARGYSPLQISLMTLCVVWGSIGSALYFSRRKPV